MAGASTAASRAADSVEVVGTRRPTHPRIEELAGKLAGKSRAPAIEANAFVGTSRPPANPESVAGPSRSPTPPPATTSSRDDALSIPNLAMSADEERTAPPALSRVGRSISQQILPIASTSAISLTGPVRPGFHTSQSTSAIPTELTNAAQHPRRFAPPARILRPAPLLEEPLDYESEMLCSTPSDVMTMRGPARTAQQNDRIAGLGIGRRPMALGQAQRRANTTPITSSVIPPLPSASSQLHSSVLERVTELENKEEDRKLRNPDGASAPPTPSRQVWSPHVSPSKPSGSSGSRSRTSSSSLRNPVPVEMADIDFPPSPSLRPLKSDTRAVDYDAGALLPNTVASPKPHLQAHEDIDHSAVKQVPTAPTVPTVDEVHHHVVPPKSEEPKGEVLAAMMAPETREILENNIAQPCSSPTLDNAAPSLVPVILPSEPVGSKPEIPILPKVTKSEKSGHRPPTEQNAKASSRVQKPWAIDTGRSTKGTSGTKPVIQTRKPFKPTTLAAQSAKASKPTAMTTQNPAGPAIAKPPVTTQAALPLARHGSGQPVATGTNNENAPSRAAQVAAPKAVEKPNTGQSSSIARVTKADTVVKAKAGLAHAKPSAPTVIRNVSTTALPPVKKDKIRLKPPLPSFRPTKGLSRMVNGETSALKTSTTSGASSHSRVKPESVPLPLSPSEKARMEPKQIPLPRSPLHPTSSTTLASMATSAPEDVELMAESEFVKTPSSPESESVNAPSDVASTPQMLPMARMRKTFRRESPIVIAPPRPAVPVITKDVDGMDFLLLSRPESAAHSGKPADAAIEEDLMSGRYNSTSTRNPSSHPSTAPPQSCESESEDDLEGVSFSLPRRRRIQPQPKARPIEKDLMECSAPTRATREMGLGKAAGGEMFTGTGTPMKGAEHLLARLVGTPRRALGPRDVNTPTKEFGNVSA